MTREWRRHLRVVARFVGCRSQHERGVDVARAEAPREWVTCAHGVVMTASRGREGCGRVAARFFGCVSHERACGNERQSQQGVEVGTRRWSPGGRERAPVAASPRLESDRVAERTDAETGRRWPQRGRRLRRRGGSRVHREVERFRWPARGFGALEPKDQNREGFLNMWHRLGEKK